MFTWELKQNNITKPFLIPFRIVGILTFFIFIYFLKAPTSSDLKSVNHKLVTWHADRPYGLYFIKSIFKEKLSSQVLQHVCQVHVIRIWILVFNATFSSISAISWSEYPERTTYHGQATDKLYHLRLLVECALFCNLQSCIRFNDWKINEATFLNETSACVYSTLWYSRFEVTWFFRDNSNSKTRVRFVYLKNLKSWMRVQ